MDDLQTAVAARYRAEAERVRELAGHASNEVYKVLLLDTAEQYDTLAATAERSARN